MFMRVVSMVIAGRRRRRHRVARRGTGRLNAPAATAAPANPQLDQYKRNVGLEVDAMQENIQKWNDSVFSFGELGFQEFETTKYLTDILKKNGFTVQDRRRRHSDGVDGAAGDRASR